MIPSEPPFISLNQLRNFFETGQTRPLEFRIASLKKLKSLIEENTDEIIESVRMDLGKPATEAYTGELSLVLSEIKAALKNIQKWSGVRRLWTPVIMRPGKSVSRPVPYGLVLIISPWNYPFFLTLAPLVSAIAAGNCAVIKPSELSNNASECLGRLIKKYFDPAYITVQTGGPEVSVQLISQKPDYLFFTGSSQVGKKVMSACAENLVPLTLELGGKNPCIVHDVRNVNRAARRIIWGKFFNAGQTCTAPDYLLVSSGLKKELIHAMKRTLLSFYGSDPGKSPDFARIINEKHALRLSRLAEGYSCIHGGSFIPEEKFISPTLLEIADWESPIMREEIFGPLLPVLEYSSLKNALDRINSLGSPLTTYLFSDDSRIHKAVRNSVSSGSLVINTVMTQLFSSYLPFGGVGESGMGQYRGYCGFSTFSHYRSEYKRSLKIDIPVFYPPYKTPLWIIKKLMPFLF